jgi:hypothetical protein
MNTAPLLLLLAALVLAGSPWVAANGQGGSGLPGSAVDKSLSSGSYSLNLSLSSSGDGSVQSSSGGSDTDSDDDIWRRMPRMSALDYNIGFVELGDDPMSLPLLRKILENPKDENYADVKEKVEKAQQKWRESSKGRAQANKEEEARKSKTTAQKFSKEQMDRIRKEAGLPVPPPSGRGGSRGFKADYGQQTQQQKPRSNIVGGTGRGQGGAGRGTITAPQGPPGQAPGKAPVDRLPENMTDEQKREYFDSIPTHQAVDIPLPSPTTSMELSLTDVKQKGGNGSKRLKVSSKPKAGTGESSSRGEKPWWDGYFGPAAKRRAPQDNSPTTPSQAGSPTLSEV